jgi:hypothetical protein
MQFSMHVALGAFAKIAMCAASSFKNNFESGKII